VRSSLRKAPYSHRDHPPRRSSILTPHVPMLLSGRP
jgi:hypothetical protein